MNCFVAAALSVADEPFFDGVSSRKGLGEQTLWFPCIKAKTSDLQVSQIDDDIADRLRAANEKVAGGRLFEWLGSVDDCPGNQTALTVVTNASAAGPKGGDVARFGQVQNALIF